MKISVLHATCRPRKAIEYSKKWMYLAKHPENIEYIFSFDNTAEANEVIKENPEINFIMLPYRLGCVNKLNATSYQATGDIFIQASEDVIPPQDWDELLISAADWSKPVVLDCSDGHDDDRDLLKCTILNRAFW